MLHPPSFLIPDYCQTHARLGNHDFCPDFRTTSHGSQGVFEGPLMLCTSGPNAELQGIRTRMGFMHHVKPVLKI